MAAYTYQELHAKGQLTSATVEAFQCPEDKDQAMLWDSTAVGLGVRATRGGAKSFIFQSRFQGASLRMTIGDVKVWPLGSRNDRVGPGAKVVQLGAREKARQLQALIDSGRDPREVQAEATAADVAKRSADQRHAVSVGEAWRAYLDALQILLPQR